MCMLVNIKHTEEIKATRHPEEIVVRYKVLRLKENYIVSPYFPHVWEAGVNKADKVSFFDMGETYVIIDNAIHVCTILSAAFDIIRDSIHQYNESINLHITKVYCKNEDLVGIAVEGFEEEAYSQVTLKQEDYDLLMREHSCV